MPMNVSFDGGKTWVSENDMGAVDREIQKMNERKEKNTQKSKKQSVGKLSTIRKNNGR